MRVAEFNTAAAAIARMHGYGLATGTFPRSVWLDGPGSVGTDQPARSARVGGRWAAVIRWTSRAETNRHFATLLRVHEDDAGLATGSRRVGVAMQISPDTSGGTKPGELLSLASVVDLIQAALRKRRGRRRYGSF